MSADHKAALRFTLDEGCHCPACNLKRSYLERDRQLRELREAARAVVIDHYDSYTQQITRANALRKLLEVEP